MFISSDDIKREVSIINLANELGIKLNSTSAGKFDYKCKCPSKKHKDGSERTDSCHISSETNSFYCFGCNAGNNVIDFYMLVQDKSFRESYDFLKNYVKNPTGVKREQVKKQSNFLILLEISETFRNAILNNSKELKFINSVMMDTDKKLSNVESSDLDTPKIILDNIKKAFDKRFNK